MRKHAVIAALALVSAFATAHQVQAKTAPPGIIVCDKQGCRPESPPPAASRAGRRERNASRTARHSRRSREAHQRASYGVSGSAILDQFKLTPRQRQSVGALAAEINRKLARWVRKTGNCAGGREELATYYSSGRRTANGERFNPHGLTVAMRSRTFGGHFRITNPHNGRSVVVRHNDFGPATIADLDLSLGAARALGMRSSSYVCVSRL